VGGLIALLVLIAIGAVVLYEMTGTIEGVDTISVDNTGTASVSVEHGVSTATITTTYDNVSGFAILLNDKVVDNITSTGSATKTYDVADNIIRGTNTLKTTGTVNGTATTSLDVETYTEHTVTGVEEKGSTIFSLLTILAIVVVAAIIIAVVMRAIGGGGGAPGIAPAGPPGPPGP